MAIRAVIQIGDPRLKAINRFILKSDISKVKNVIKDLTDTMLENDIVGIAAPQIGVNLKLFITEPRETVHRKANQSDKLRVYINPEITYYSEETSEIYEGCGSVGVDFFGPVIRPKKIIIEAYDINLKKFRLTCDGLLARVIQHEYDHLSGIEFIEKISDYKKVMNAENYQKLIRMSEKQISAGVINEVDCIELT